MTASQILVIYLLWYASVVFKDFYNSCFQIIQGFLLAKVNLISLGKNWFAHFCTIFALWIHNHDDELKMVFN